MTARHGAVLGMLIVWVCACAAASPITVEGELTILVGQGQPAVPPRTGHTYLLTVGAPPKAWAVELRFARPPTNLATGDRVLVIGTTSTDPGTGATLLIVQSYTVTRPSANKDFKYPNGTLIVTSLTILTRICGKASVSAALVPRFRREWATTLDSYYRACSWGRASFPAVENLVLDLTDAAADLGCYGTWQLMAWRSDRCGTAEVFGWRARAMALVAKRWPRLNLTRYSHQVLVLPENNCVWTGMASVGCGTSCVVWLRGKAAWPAQGVAFHELGHNLGLQHASAGGKEYGDGGCAMGCCNPVCFNAAHSWQAAWARPVAVLNASTLPAPKPPFTFGVWRTYMLPATALKRDNHVQVRPTWLGTTFPGAVPGYFLSYRQAVGKDTNLKGAPVALSGLRATTPLAAGPRPYLGSVHVHVFNGTQSVGGFKTELVALLGVGQTFAPPKMRFAVKFLGSNATHAHVAVQRRSS